MAFPQRQYVQDAVNYAWSKGVVLVGAAGNNNREETFYPASFNNVISVSATQINDEFSSWSSYGPKVDVSAPGSSVQTTNCTVCTYAGHNTWGPHTYISGTSFATPNVAGVVALIRARYPSYTPAQVVSRLVATVDDLGRPGYENRYGNGRVNAFRAVGGSVAAPAVSRGDALEPNHTLGLRPRIPLGTTRRRSIRRVTSTSSPSRCHEPGGLTCGSRAWSTPVSIHGTGAGCRSTRSLSSTPPPASC